MPRMDEEIVEMEEKYYKITGGTVFKAIFYAAITALTTIVLPLSSTSVFTLFGISFEPFNQTTIVVIGTILTILSFIYNLLYKAKPLEAGIVGIIRYLFIFVDTLAFFGLFNRIELNNPFGFGMQIVLGAMFIFPYWYGTMLLIGVGLYFLKSILQTAFWKELRVKKQAAYKK